MRLSDVRLNVYKPDFIYLPVFPLSVNVEPLIHLKLAIWCFLTCMYWPILGPISLYLRLNVGIVAFRVSLNLPIYPSLHVQPMSISIYFIARIIVCLSTYH